MQEGLPQIYNYTDYQVYLRDVFKARKLVSPYWSYGVWARDLGLKSSSTLIMILQGNRNPSSSLTKQIAAYLKLKSGEAQYFADLVNLKKSKNDPHLTQALTERLKKQHPKKEFRLLSADHFMAISNWHYYAIREMVDLKDFREDLEWIQKKLNFKVSKKEIEQAIEALLRLELIERDENGYLRYAKTTIATADGIPDEGLKRFHEQMLDNARASIRSVDRQSRDISGVTFTLRKEDLPKAKEIVRNMYQELLRMTSKNEADAVFQLETTLFPLTQFDVNEGEKK
jgi:uncharacterized protein (TIGR02147 family)